MSNILDKIKLSGVTYDIIDSTAIHSLDGYYTSGQTNDAITAATSALAESIAEQGYQTSGDVQNAISGKLDTSVFETYSGNVETALGTKFAGATWNSTDKKIYFYDNASATGTALAYIDATDFVKDGFLSSVTIDNKTISGESVPCLVFIWNTDAGIQETDVPLSGIFDPSNYYSKAETDEAISAATSGKADASTVTAVNDVLTAHTADTTIHVTSSDKTTWSGKQDALVSGTNIKTINGTSILGSGDLQVQSQPTVSGTTLIFS
jgi:hypothetical protein